MAHTTPQQREMVTQHELHRLHRLQVEHEELERRLAAAKADRDELDQHLRELLDAGLSVQPGTFMPRVVEKKGQRRPRWKEHFVAVKGAAEADRIIAETQPGASSFSIALVARS
jgi:hypothetical protein